MNIEFTDDQFSDSVRFGEQIHSAQETIETERNQRLEDSGILEFINDERGWSRSMREIKPGTADSLSAENGPSYIVVSTSPHPMGGVSGYAIKAIPQQIAELAERELQWLSTGNEKEVSRALHSNSAGRRDPRKEVLTLEAFKEAVNQGNYLK